MVGRKQLIIRFCVASWTTPRAGPVVKQLSPTGILLASAVLSGLGLMGLSVWGSGWATFGAATVFAVGVCYFWPTMLGVVSERIPRSGALGLGLMGTVGMATVGLVTSPTMGRIADRYAHERIPVEQTVVLLETAVSSLVEVDGPDARAAADASRGVVDEYRRAGALPSPGAANALRAVIASGASAELVDQAQAVLGPADNYGGRISFRYVVPLCGLLALIFGTLYASDKRAGGYRVRRMDASA